MSKRTSLVAAALFAALALLLGAFETAATVCAQEAPIAPAPEAPVKPAAPDAPKVEEEPSPTPKEVKREVTRIFALKANKDRLGTSTTTYRWFADDSLEIETDQIIRIVRTMGDTKDLFEIGAKSTEWHDAKGVMTGSLSVRTESGVEITDRISIADGQLHHRHTGPGVTKDDHHDLPEKYKSRESAYRELLKAWKADNSKKTLTYVDWDTMRHGFERHTLTITGKGEVQRGDEKISGTKLSHRSRDGVLDFVLDDDCLPIGGKVLGFIDMEWMSDDDVFVPGNTAALSAIIVANAYISGWRNIESISLTFDVEGDTDEEEFLHSNDYQTVTREGTKRTIELKQQRIPVGHKAPALPIAEVPEDVAVFLKPTPMSQSDNAAIKAKAAEISNGATNSAAVTRSIVRWVFRNVKKQSGTRSGASAVEVLDDLEGDCTEHAALSVALLRAAGVPARSCSGLVYGPMGTEKAVWGFHAWAEAWIGKWIPVDATVNEVGIGARFIFFGHDEPTTDGGTLGITRTMGKTTITITAYKVSGKDKVLVAEPTVDQKTADEAKPAESAVPDAKPNPSPADKTPAEEPATPETPSSNPTKTDAESSLLRLITSDFFARAAA